MNLRTTLVLLVALAVVGSYVYFGELNKEAPTPTPFGGRAVPTPSTVLNISPDELTTIQVRATEGRAVVTRPGGGDWVVAAPVPGQADQARINALATRLSPLNATRELPAERLSQFGLENATTVISIGRRDGGTEDLSVGERTPDESGYYLRKGNSGPVYIVNRVFVDDVKRLITDPPLPRPAQPPVAVPSTPISAATPAS